jgi:hypothetical protein
MAFGGGNKKRENLPALARGGKSSDGRMASEERNGIKNVSCSPLRFFTPSFPPKSNRRSSQNYPREHPPDVCVERPSRSSTSLHPPSLASCTPNLVASFESGKKHFFFLRSIATVLPPRRPPRHHGTTTPPRLHQRPPPLLTRATTTTREPAPSEHHGLRRFQRSR